MTAISKVDALGVLLALQTEHRRTALSTPKGKRAFDYGEAVGMDRGIDHCIQALTAEIEKHESSDIDDESQEG